MKILLIGGTGYIGKIFSDIFEEKKIEFKCIGRNTAQSFVIGEPVDELIFQDIDIVFYLSWDFDTTNSAYEEKNINSLSEVIEIVERKKLKLVFFSTYHAAIDGSSLYNVVKGKCEKIVLDKKYKVVRLGSVIIEGTSIEGFYGNILNFMNKYRIFPKITPEVKKFHLTSKNDLINFVDNIENFTNNIHICASPSGLKLDELLSVNEKEIFKLPINWKIIYLTLRLSEFLKIKLKFRSDSILSIWGSNHK